MIRKESRQAYMLTGHEGYERPIMLNNDDAQTQQMDYWDYGSRMWVIQASDLLNDCER